MVGPLAKQYIRIGDKPILFYTLQKFEECSLVEEVILVSRDEDLPFVAAEIIDEYGFKKVRKIISGGKERQESVFLGLKAIESNPDIVVIHDGVRPFVTLEMIESGLKLCQIHGAVITAVPLTSTIKKVKDNQVIETVNREEYWDIQTPQIFRYDLILSAHEKAASDGFIGTDDSMLVERMGTTVNVMKGAKNNIKVTTPEDLKLANYIIENES